eukprot:GEMP01027145.1.p1 GENE.GEMP01027145.1~~GEMP01027145.1.p1  ORF type:complete len:177 (+),score=19.57 GEMP01027145.1:27-533(+)
MTFGAPPLIPVRDNLPCISSQFNRGAQEQIYKSILIGEAKFLKRRGVVLLDDGSTVPLHDYVPDYKKNMFESVNFIGLKHPTYNDVRPTKTPIVEWDEEIPEYVDKYKRIFDKDTVLQMIENNRSFDFNSAKYRSFSGMHMRAERRRLVRSQSESAIPTHPAILKTPC